MPRHDLDGNEDPQGDAKDKDERKFARELAVLLGDQYDDLIDELGVETPEDPGDDFWAHWSAAMLVIATPFLLGIAEKAAKNGVDRLNIGVIWDSVQDEVEKWASDHSFRLVSDITNTSRDALRTQLSNFYAGKLDHDALVAVLQNRYGVTRATAIATTETTRGFEAGLNIYEDELRRLGITTDSIWFVEDNEACPMCFPNHKKLRDRDGWTQSGVPPHPHCRCWTEIVALDENGNIMSVTKHALIDLRKHNKE